MSETRNIVILGASFAGLMSAHYIIKHTLPQLSKAKDPSTHFWWHIAAPREIVSSKELSHNKCFVPIMDGFKQYSHLKDSIKFHHGEATGLDTEARIVSWKPAGSDATESLSYYALVLATGIKSPTPLTTLHGDHTISIKALDEMNKKLATAQTVVIGGGGPVGVETAGEIGNALQGKAKITLVAGGNKLLPVLRRSLSEKAGKQLEKIGVKLLYNVKVEGYEEAADGKTSVKLSNGESILADVYIPAVGVTPNTQFLPSTLKADSGYIKTNPTTLRVDEAGPRVYALGDVGGYDKGGVLCLQAALPTFGANFSHDVLADAKAGSVPEKKFTRKDAETQVVPVGAKTGVGAFNGWQLPGFAVSMIKGKDYMLKMMPETTQGTKIKA